MLVRAMVMAAGTPGGAYQADVRRSSLACAVPRVTRAAFYRWFDGPLEQGMVALAERALAYARAQPVDWPGPLSAVKDWYMVDSTTVKVRDALIADVPGTGDDAALKVHTGLSGRRRKRCPVTTDSRHGYAVAPNLLAQQFDVAQLLGAHNILQPADVTGQNLPAQKEQGTECLVLCRCTHMLLDC
jgi:hypothetical protein